MSSRDDPLIGTTVRDYEILEVLGRGGMGAVYRARHVLLKQERALKLIRTDLAGEPAFVKRFLREAQVLASLDSPHLVRLYEFGALGEQSFFMVMELLRGETVQQRLKACGRLEVTDAVRIVREAAVALAAAHRKGVVHRDISPDNLYLVREGEEPEVTKVIDFGIAKPLGTETSELTHTRGFIGKFEFCSPEQCGALEDGETIDGRSDIYSLGVTLYSMLAGRVPFQAATAEQYIYKHLTSTPEPLSRHVPAGTVPEAIERVLMKALSKKRGDRQGSMAELVAELDQAMAEAAPPRHVPGIGETFAHRYRIEQKLGEGGMGAVYRSYDLLAQVPVALKVILRAANPSALERFRREAVLARQVAHPNVCRIYDLGEADGVHYVTMELSEGEHLGAYVNARGRLPVAEALGLFVQIVEGVAAAHRAGIVHRDLKPQNVMVEPSGQVRVVDFGLALAAGMERLTAEGGWVGTPLYMAPEQILGHDVDARADLYALGTVLFELLTGRAPFAGRSRESMLRAHVQEVPAAPSSLAPGIPREVDALVLRCLEKAPEDRYPSAAALLEALRELQAGVARAVSEDATRDLEPHGPEQTKPPGPVRPHARDRPRVPGDDPVVGTGHDARRPARGLRGVGLSLLLAGMAISTFLYSLVTGTQTPAPVRSVPTPPGPRAQPSLAAPSVPAPSDPPPRRIRALSEIPSLAPEFVSVRQITKDGSRLSIGASSSSLTAVADFITTLQKRVGATELVRTTERNGVIEFDVITAPSNADDWRPSSWSAPPVPFGSPIPSKPSPAS